jgi:hypothetical protein
MNQLLVSRYLRSNFHSLIQERYVMLKYEIEAARGKMIHFLSNTSCRPVPKHWDGDRGLKRKLEMKKFRLLGQIQVVKQYIQALLEPGTDDHNLLSKEHLFDLIYRHLDRMQKTKIEHSFLIHYLGQKSRKREGKRFIDFLKGAKS